MIRLHALLDIESPTTAILLCVFLDISSTLVSHLEEEFGTPFCGEGFVVSELIIALEFIVDVYRNAFTNCHIHASDCLN